MKVLFRFLGRALFVVLLFTLAFEKLNHPEIYKDTFANAYSKFHSHVAPLKVVPLPSERAIESKIALIIKFVGLFEALMAALILTGNGSGAFLAVLYFVIVGAYWYLPFDVTKLLATGFVNREKLVNGGALLGLAMLLISN